MRRAAAKGFINATDCADYLTKKGMPFRDAYEGRKDVNERAKVINSADLAFLCLPDAASREVMPLLRPDVKVLDTSTAFRTDPNWVYASGTQGPEGKDQKCLPRGGARLLCQRVYQHHAASGGAGPCQSGPIPAAPAISGYSGGGKKMIADYESPDRPAHSKLDAPKSYGLKPCP